MICSICQSENDKFSATCKKCGGFLQNRVPNLDLFDTLWKVFENPREAFRLVILAEHKNYAVFLYTLYGILLTCSGFAYFRIGNRFDNVLFLLFWAFLLGIPFGGILGMFISFSHWILSKMMKGKASFPSSVGIVSYSFAPLLLSLVLILPMKLMTFGMYLFTSNPHPMSLKPLSYILLLGLDSIMSLWGFILLIVGTHEGNQLSIWKSFVLVIILCVLLVSIFVFGGEYLVAVL
jgi:hypothetical protein